MVDRFILQAIKRRFIVSGLAGLCVLLLGVMIPAYAADSTDPFQSLKKRLVADGFDSARIQTIFSSPQVSFEIKGVSAYFRHNEASLNYKQFSRTWAIDSARDYMQTHRQALNAAQHQYGVDKEVITAIILVETRLGTYTGKRSVMNTLATLSAMRDNAARQIIWDSMADDDRRMPRDEFDKKADEKTGWAYRELTAFLTYTEKEGMDPTTIKGSYAGAMGISQFIPTNIPKFGKDGNNDGKINLFDHADAIPSIAAYLKNYGWKPGISRDKAFKVVYHYNHSKYYVNAILDVAEQLKG
ncbi:MltB2: membrane-bound lytic murein transglycosylase B-like protein [Desulfosarcina variabilis str. Montpellier]